MSTYTWPAGIAYTPLSADWWLVGSDITTRSVLGAGQQTSAVPGAVWSAVLNFSPDSDARRHALLGFLRGLNGKEHRVALWDMRKFSAAGVQGSPSGTIATSGLTLSAAAAQFASSVSIAGCGAGATLAAGDMFKVGGQLIENTALATANGSGVMTVAVPQRLRAAAASGAAVTVVKPTALFVLKEPFHALRERARYTAFSVEFEEVYA